jgi:hypothetical protein
LSADLRGAFTVPDRRNHPALTEKDLPDFLVKLDNYGGEPITKLAIRLLALTFVRTSELRCAEWSAILNEIGFAPDVIERQLAHLERNKVRAAYNRAQYLPERTRMMQQWADLLDAIKTKDKKVLRGRFGKMA